MLQITHDTFGHLSVLYLYFIILHFLSFLSLIFSYLSALISDDEVVLHFIYH